MFDGLNPLAVALLGFAVIGTVQFIKALFARDWRAAAIIFVSGLAGAIFAPFAGGDLSWFQGMLIGLQASGIVTTAAYVSGRS